MGLLLNYLAHFHLSHGDDSLLLGALLGDFIKGPLMGERSKVLEQGILLHRKIDAFTDRHELLQQTRSWFPAEYRRYSGIMTDVVFDHFLNRYWQRFHHQSLTEFSGEVYQLLSSNSLLPEMAQRQADNLIQYDVFAEYKHWRTVEGALARISQRLRRDNPLTDAAAVMMEHYENLEQLFLNFYPQLQQYTTTVRVEFNCLDDIST